MGKYDELVEQARKLAGQIDPLSIDGPDSKLLRELATAITTLEAELEKLRPQVKVADDQWDAKCDELAAMKARGDRLAGFAKHDRDCVLGIPKAIRSRSSIQEECTCGLSEALTQYRAMKEKSDGR